LRWAKVLVLAVVGFTCALLGEKMDISLLTTAGFCCLGAVSVWIGIEVMITRRIVAPSRYDRRSSETYIGIAAIGLGLLELFAPDLFDAWGEGYPEVLYRIR